MRNHAVLGIISFLATGACSREPAANNEVDIATAADEARASVSNYAALPDERPRTAAPSRPTPTPSQASPAAAEETASAAAALVTRYYALISAGRYAQAWRLWDREGQASGMDQDDFAASFAKYADYRAEVGAPGRVDAGAGQRYVTVPVRISGHLKDGGRPFAMEGPVTLHRTADIDGATAEQRRWQISDSGVRPRPLEAATEQPSAPNRATARYSCDDGTTFTAVFDNLAGTATLRFADGGEVRLSGQRPASGIWYRNARYDLRGKGREATLTRGRAVPVDCVAAQ